MHDNATTQPDERACTWKLAPLILLAAFAGLPGCAALSNPVANGVPVRRLPPQLLGESRENKQTLPLALLRQPPPEHYLLASGDVLGVWIEGVLGEKGQAPPVQISTVETRHTALGFPIPVRGDGTITLPLVPAIKVEGMTLEQAEEAIRKAYTVDKQILQPNRERILVTLQRPREYHILVIRQDGGGEAGGVTGGGGAGVNSTGFVVNIGAGVTGSRRGTGYAIDLPAYENDVLNALARTGGFPSTEAINEVIVERGSFRGPQEREAFMKELRALPPGNGPMTLDTSGIQRIRIPLRYRPGQEPTFRPEDVVLQTGDIVFIEAREADVFYTAGLLPAGQYVLPRDSDLDIVQTLLRIGGSVNAGGLSTLNVNGTLLGSGLGNPSPSLVSIIRKTPCGGQVTIRVDLNRALRDPRERILIQPKDIIFLQETPQEAIARYLSETFKFSYAYDFIKSSRAIVSSQATGP